MASWGSWNNKHVVCLSNIYGWCMFACIQFLLSWLRLAKNAWSEICRGPMLLCNQAKVKSQKYRKYHCSGTATAVQSLGTGFSPWEPMWIFFLLKFVSVLEKIPVYTLGISTQSVVHSVKPSAGKAAPVLTHSLIELAIFTPKLHPRS